MKKVTLDKTRWRRMTCLQIYGCHCPAADNLSISLIIFPLSLSLAVARKRIISAIFSSDILINNLLNTNLSIVAQVEVEHGAELDDDYYYYRLYLYV